MRSNKEHIMRIFKCVIVNILLFGVFVSFLACQNPNTGLVETDGENQIATQDNTEKTDTTTENNSMNAAKKPIDIYIIAGQSNAAGYTRIDPTVLGTLWDKYNVGVENVIYAGRAQSTANVNTPQVSTIANEIQWQPVRAGFGKTTDHMGVEVGMAKALSEEYYTGSRTAGIIKLAHGGTSLLNTTTGENAATGNWVSPSYAESKGLSYSGITGGLYRALLDQVTKNVAELKEQGYDSINIKGVFWMQGESDRTAYPTVYEKALTCFINDIRRDLGKITNEDLSSLPFMIGEISRTCSGANSGNVTINETFIEMQRGIAEKIDNVYIIPSGQFEIVTWDATLEENVLDPYQNDTVHWNTEDIFRIGELIGKCIIDIQTK